MATTTATAPNFRIPAPATPLDRPAIPVQPRVSRAVYLRRRLVLGLAVLTAALALVLFGQALSAEAGGGAPVTGGHVVVEPGQTLWEIAVDNAPPGADARQYLHDLQQLNGIQGNVPAWTVVLLPRV